ncbi:aspartate-semialdehyde dehydrogenase [Psychromonas sp. Urea-02u-13]|uniref:aspartate-semialdehyde dehydrogenase n=1 Tax=Psychromonas sp. Urea-02u-13 TaxID=2058326 RepID=UPI000C31D895|nr:aspartate-semialdehyde dehydrogenase [Psychromonas sp. Urea-02u-13]PKG39585.1 aspartate-semialdehyde dehydrogenase [Psychromonas sp. Urea-02u-13]
MKSEYNIALIGDLKGCIEATLEVLAKRDFPIGKIFPLQNEAQDDEEETQTVMFSGKPVDVIDINGFDWEKVDIAFFLTDIETTNEYANAAAEHCVVIDNSGAFLEDESVPLVQVDVNEENLASFTQTNKIAIPSSEAAQLALSVVQLHQEVGLVRINVSSYQSVSIAGKVGVTTLAGETARLLNAKEVKPETFPQQTAFNIFPQVGEFNDEGITFGELRLVNEMRRLLNDPSIIVSSTQVVVPLFYGCAQSVHLQTHYPVDMDEVAQSLHHSEGVTLSKTVCDYPNMISDVVSNTDVHVGRLRKDLCDESGINMWVCADNYHFGVATTVIKVAEKLITSYL